MEFQVLWWIHDFLAGLGLAQEHLDYVSLRVLGRPEETISSASISSQLGLRKGMLATSFLESLCSSKCVWEKLQDGCAQGKVGRWRGQGKSAQDPSTVLSEFEVSSIRDCVILWVDLPSSCLPWVPFLL